ncbi:hypothetical protein L227DRAFT_609413 [Lentinus tigrinus ALCF2SS1-6]|uniref:Uncharacterized protein n=1 Tax=Lentinus tigrinus ALCF2SS1-6 TaxID=1328759 RepID=A0A5C2SIB1_9APHY|nr:hypothetical protein L227DRAFT_609413 [Lentinus tigrinus ALCF2SS1-6]
MSGVQLIDNADVGETSAPGIGFALVPTDISIPTMSVTLNWWPTGCNQPHDVSPENWTDTASGRALAQLGCGQTPDSFNVWVDSNPYYSWNVSSILLQGDGRSSISFRPEQTFDTTHNFTWISVEESLAFRRQHSISAWYPFDKYTVTTTLEVFSGDNSTSLPISFLHLYGGLSGYNLAIKSIDHVRTSRTDQALYVVFTIQRCIGVKLFALTIFLTDYSLAAAMVWVAVCAHFGRPLPESVLFLPITNILLLPQLRASMPGVPDFGMFMDLFGYYVNILAIVFSAMFMFFKIVGGRYRGHRVHGHSDSDVESTWFDHSASSAEKPNAFLLTTIDNVKIEKVCATVEHIEHADAESPA